MSESEGLWLIQSAANIEALSASHPSSCCVDQPSSGFFLVVSGPECLLSAASSEPASSCLARCSGLTSGHRPLLHRDARVQSTAVQRPGTDPTAAPSCPVGTRHTRGPSRLCTHLLTHPGGCPGLLRPPGPHELVMKVKGRSPLSGSRQMTSADCGELGKKTG